MRILLLLFTFSSALLSATNGDVFVNYSDRFKSKYPLLSSSHDLKSVPTEGIREFRDERGMMTASLLRTDGSKVPYDKAKANISVFGQGVNPIRISIADFRTVTIQWLGSNIVYIYVDVGHIAATESLLNVRERRWIYQKSISYNKHANIDTVTYLGHYTYTNAKSWIDSYKSESPKKVYKISDKILCFIQYRQSKPWCIAMTPLNKAVKEFSLEAIDSSKSELIPSLGYLKETLNLNLSSGFGPIGGK